MEQVAIFVFHGKEPVAAVNAPFDGDIIASLEYAYRWTNNVAGSWSMGDTLDMCDNGDYNPNVTVLKPLETIRGQKWGHRSTSIGDTMLVTYDLDNTETYTVASFGFEKI